MRLFNQAVLIGTSMVFSLISTALADDCLSKGPIAQGGITFGLPAGGANPQPSFCDSKWEQGHVIVGVEAWGEKPHVSGIQFLFSDGTKSALHGSTSSENHQTVTWGRNDKISRLQMWDNLGGYTMGDGHGTADAVGRIQMEVTNGGKLDVTADVGSGGGESVLTNSGVLIGAKGASGGFLNNLQLVFMKNAVDKAEITDAKFDDAKIEQWTKDKKGIEEEDVSELIILNTNTEGEKGWSWTNEKEIAKEATKDLQETEMFGIEVGVSVSANFGIPLFSAGVEVSTETSYSKETFKGTSTTNKKDIKLSWSESGTVKPGRAIWCKAKSSSGTLTTSFEKTIELTLQGGRKFTLKQPDEYHSVGWSTAQSNYRDVPLSEISGNVEKKEDDGETKPLSSTTVNSTASAPSAPPDTTASVTDNSETATEITPESSVVPPKSTRVSSAVRPHGTLSTLVSSRRPIAVRSSALSRKPTSTRRASSTVRHTRPTAVAHPIAEPASGEEVDGTVALNADRDTLGRRTGNSKRVRDRSPLV